LGLLSAFSRLLDLLETPEDIPFLSHLIQREILYRILRTPQAERLRAIATSGDLSKRTTRAIAWLRANFTKPLHMEELASTARMGVSTLHHGPRRGRDVVKKMMTEFRQAFPDLNFWGVGDLIAEGDYVVGRWDGGGTHTGPAFDDLPVGALPAASGRKMRFTGTTVCRIVDGKIAAAIAGGGALNALPQLKLLT